MNARTAWTMTEREIAAIDRTLIQPQQSSCLERPDNKPMGWRFRLSVHRAARMIKKTGASSNQLKRAIRRRVFRFRSAKPQESFCILTGYSGNESAGLGLNCPMGARWVEFGAAGGSKMAAGA